MGCKHKYLFFVYTKVNTYLKNMKRVVEEVELQDGKIDMDEPAEIVEARVLVHRYDLFLIICYQNANEQAFRYGRSNAHFRSQLKSPNEHNDSTNLRDSSSVNLPLVYKATEKHIHIMHPSYNVNSIGCNVHI